MFCTKCGEKNDDENVYCISCGSKLDENSKFNPQKTSILQKKQQKKFNAKDINELVDRQAVLTSYKNEVEYADLLFKQYVKGIASSAHKINGRFLATLCLKHDDIISQNNTIISQNERIIELLEKLSEK